MPEVGEKVIYNNGRELGYQDGTIVLIREGDTVDIETPSYLFDAYRMTNVLKSDYPIPGKKTWTYPKEDKKEESAENSPVPEALGVLTKVGELVTQAEKAISEALKVLRENKHVIGHDEVEWYITDRRRGDTEAITNIGIRYTGKTSGGYIEGSNGIPEYPASESNGI